MCGIVGYVGNKQAYPIVMKGLKRLEYRGYDSTGVAFIHQNNLKLFKKKGRVADLEEYIGTQNVQGKICIGHTRWATQDAYHEKIISNIQEIKARNGMIIAVITETDFTTPQICDDVILIPKADEIVTPLLNVIPLQLLSYYIGIAKGCDVDKPRNLAKSVTVE